MRSSTRSAPSTRRAFVALSFVFGSALRRFFSSSASLLNTLKIVEMIIARAVRLTSPTLVLETNAASWRARHDIVSAYERKEAYYNSKQ